VIHLLDVSIRVRGSLLEDITLEVPAGAYGVLLGEARSGKTAIVEAICGLRPVEGGAIRIAGRDVTGLHPADRGIGFVPQDTALFKSLTVRENLSFGLEIRKWKPADIQDRVTELSGKLGLEPLLDRKPPALTAGEARRLALGRSLAFRPRVLCLDEPLAGLDDAERESMFARLEALAGADITTFHATRRRDVAGRLADHVYHLENGRVGKMTKSE
jgi:molybdate/tungstate transport system ATP-binding protein